MSQQVGQSPTLQNGSDDRPQTRHPEGIPIRRRLARSAWSVAAGVLVVLMLGSLAVLMVSSAPLWTWAAPGAPENDEPPRDAAADGSSGIAPK